MVKLGNAILPAGQPKPLNRSAFYISYPEFPKAIMFPYHSTLERKKINDAIYYKPYKQNNEIKVVLGTNCIETSITIPDANIDTGLVKRKVFEPFSETASLQLSFIDKFTGQQRAGRCGRTGPGRCYQLYSDTQFNEFQQCHSVEMHNTDLQSEILLLLEMGTWHFCFL